MSALRIKQAGLPWRLTILCQRCTAPRHCSLSVSLCVPQTRSTAAAVAPSTYVFTARRSLLLEAVKSHPEKYRKLLTEAKVDNAGGGEMGTRKM